MSGTANGSLSRRKPILLLVDVEPDARKTSASGDGWQSSETALGRLESLRGALERATGSDVRFNWFLRCDPQIEQTWGSAGYVAAACPRIIRTIEQAGDSAGVHIHLWRWSETHQRWWNDFDDPEWLTHCVDTSMAAHRDIFGAAPETCRFGDRWLSDEAVALERARGIRFDLTVEPGLPGGAIHDDPNASSSLPDFRRAPREPWIPSPTDFMVARNDGQPGNLWMIPLTTTRPAWRLVRRSPWLMFASRSPNLCLATSYMWPHLRRELDRPSDNPLVVVFRSGDLAQPRFMRNFENTTRLLARHPALSYCDFTTPADAVYRRASPLDNG